MNVIKKLIYLIFNKHVYQFLYELDENDDIVLNVIDMVL